MKGAHLLLLAFAHYGFLVPRVQGQENGFGASVQAGSTRLLGNSFPPIGVDAVYDYVVSVSEL